MSSNGYLPIDDSQSSSSLSHFVQREYRFGKLKFWAILILCLCGMVIIRWRTVLFSSGAANALITGTSLLKSHPSTWINKAIRDIALNGEEKELIQWSDRIIETSTGCIGRCVGDCNRGTLDCIVFCATRCTRPLPPSRLKRANRMIQKRMFRIGTEGKNLVLKTPQNGQFDQIGTVYSQYHDRRRVHCVCRFCLRIAAFCSSSGKHWDVSCDEYLRECEIQHCGVDENCVQVVHDGMESDPIVATIRVLEICLDAGLFYSKK